ncbi:MAG: hypothetical protein MJ241_06235 [Bacilli bacterium]|nr:hypothetical protein [Bacilli bacterium]
MKHFRVFSLTLVQFISLLALILTSASFIIKLDGAMFIVGISLAILAAIDLIIYVLSFIFWWNVQMEVRPDGIQFKSHFYEFKEVDFIQIMSRFPSIYGRLYVRIVFTFKNGDILKIEPSGLIDKYIVERCSDPDFIAKYKEVRGLK